MWKRMPAVENKEKTEEISFSREVKEELCRQMPGARHCQVAELAAVLSLGGKRCTGKFFYGNSYRK